MSLWTQNITACPVRTLSCSPPGTSPPSSGCDSPSVSPCPLGPGACPIPASCDLFDVCLQVRNVTQDGGFGQWSPWQPCEHLDGDNSGSCLCRARACDSPRPRCGGRDCLGPAIHIANCSRYVRIQDLDGGCLGLEVGGGAGGIEEMGHPQAGVPAKGQKPHQSCAGNWRDG